MTATATGKAGFRNFKVVAKVVESSLITSFHLQSVDGAGLATFRPGQFLVFKIPSGDGKGHVLCNYSLSGSPGDPDHYRISVKRGRTCRSGSAPITCMTALTLVTCSKPMVRAVNLFWMRAARARWCC
jgi:ferredoxin-NADP reductase